MKTRFLFAPLLLLFASFQVEWLLHSRPAPLVRATPAYAAKASSQMAIPNIIYTGNCGTATIAGASWSETTDGSGYPVYLPSGNGHGGIYCRWNPSLGLWVFDVASVSSADTNTSLSQVYYYSSGGQTLASGPVGTYAVGTLGAAPAPAVSGNPQIIAGGSAVAVMFTSRGTAVKPSNGVYNPAGTQVSTASVNGGSPAPGNSDTQNGWTLTANNDYATGSVQAPASAMPGTGYLAQVGESSGYGYVYFDVVAGSGGTGSSLPAQTVTETIFTGASSRAPVSRSARAAALAAFSVLAASGSVSPARPPATLSPRTAVIYAFSQQSARGTLTGAVRAAVNPAVTEYVPSQAVALPPQTLTETVFTSLAARGPVNFAPRTLMEGVVFSSAARGGRVAPAGTTAPPILALEAPLFTSAASRGAVHLAPRTRTLQVLNESPAAGPQARTPRLVQNSVVLQSAASGHLTPAPLPQNVDSRDPFVVLIADLRLLLSQMQGNPMTQNQALMAVLDKLAASYRINELSLLANTLAALPTLIRGGDGVTSTVYGFGADAPILALLPAADAMLAQGQPNLILAGIYRPLMAALAQYLSKLSFGSLDAYLSSLNTPVPFQALIHPNTALIYSLFVNGQGTQLLSPNNVFAPQTTFGTAAAGAAAGSLVFMHLSDIPAANVVNPAPYLSTQGYSAAKGVSALITAAVNGTLTATLTAFGQNAAGQAVTNRTWTAVLDNAAAGATVAFISQVAGDRLHGITSIAAVGAATAGGFTLNSVLERVVS